MPCDFEIAAQEPRSGRLGARTQSGEGKGPDLWGKSLPEQRPNAGGAKAESQEALEVTA